MRKTIIAAVALLMSSTAAFAGDTYVGTYGGANWDDVISSYGWVDVKDNTGYVIGAVLGTSVKSLPGLHIEADLSFRHNGIDVDWCEPLKANHDTTALLANAVYDVPLDLGPIHPYVLAGAGFAHTEATVDGLVGFKVESDGVAWQLGAGVNTALADGVTFGVGYRYLKAPELSFEGVNVSDGSNDSVVAELKFAL